MGLIDEAVNSLLETLRASQAADEEQEGRPGLELFHKGRAETTMEAIQLIESARG
jgi:hypothetical protein